jgi:hypothetical protein
MTANSVEFNQAIQHIASVSQQSGTAIQEVALTTDAIRHLVNDVAPSAEAASRIAGILRFRKKITPQFQVWRHLETVQHCFLTEP